MSDKLASALDLRILDTNHGLVAFATDDESVSVLTAGLSALGDTLEVRRGTIRQAIKHFEREVPSTAIMVDISGLPDAQAELDSLARVCPPSTQVFVIGDNSDIAFYRMVVTDFGATDYLPKPLTRDTLQRLVLPRLTGGSTEPVAGRGGHIVAVCGARGGVGATTMAVNLALALSSSAKGHVAVLDLNIQAGSVALMLSGRPGQGLRIALEDATRADSLFLERTAITIDPRLKMIAAEEAFDVVPNITEAGVTRVLDLLQRKFNYVVVDLPIPLPREMIPAISMFRQVIVVMGPDVASLRDAQGIRRMITKSTGSDRCITVLNRADIKGGLPETMVEKGLGTKPDIVIPDLGRRMVDAVNLGIPALKHVPTLQRHLAPLVREIAGVAEGRKKWSLRRMLRK